MERRKSSVENVNLDNIGLVDLHLHLDGSLSVESVKELMRMQGIKNEQTDEELLKRLQVSVDCKNLNEYLEKFEYPLSLLQTEEALSFAVYKLMEELKSQGIIYAEIRFAPQLHTKKGMSQKMAVEAAIRGLNRSSFDAGLILCCMRGNDNHAENMETVEAAEKYLGKGVVAIDLAGAEGLFPTKDFRDIFEFAGGKHIPFTIHAGEADDYTSVEYALEFGAKRIGHGVRSVENPDTLKKLADSGVTLELCPTSNLNTNIYENIKEYPVRELMAAGVKVTVNTDNMTVSGTDIKSELTMLADTFGFDEEDVRTFEKNAVRASFASELLKGKLLRLL